jgi:hypothetical protein
MGVGIESRGVVGIKDMFSKVLFKSLYIKHSVNQPKTVWKFPFSKLRPMLIQVLQSRGNATGHANKSFVFGYQNYSVKERLSDFAKTLPC